MTATAVPVPARRFVVDAAIGQDLLVEPAGVKDQVTIAGGTNPVLGPTEAETFAAGDEVTVNLLNKGGTLLGIAGEAIAMHAEVFAGAGGMLYTTGTVSVGYALDAATAQGDRIEFVKV